MNRNSTTVRRSTASLTLALGAAAFAMFGHTTGADAAVSITVIPSLAPNAFGSPSWTSYVSNAVGAIESGATTSGSGAAQYDALPNNSTLDYREAIVTGFDSWRGVAAPNVGTYSPEVGNRMHFGLHVVGDGINKFSISQLSFVGTSTDPGNVLSWGNAAGVYTYSADYVGIDYVDGIKGNGNDLTITSGANTQLVDEIVGRGSGNSLDIYTTDPGATLQDKINGAAAKFGITSDFSLTGQYFLGDTNGLATVNYAVPEPTGLALLGLGAGALLLRRRRSTT